MPMNPTAAHALANARSFLFVPANRPERFLRAIESPADAVVLDLEDSVPAADKWMARAAISERWPWLSKTHKTIVLRINPPLGVAGMADLQWMGTLEPSPAIMVSKAEFAKDLEAVQRMAPDAPLLPLIESALGYLNLEEIAAANNVIRLVVGHIDFMVDTGISCSVDQRELDQLRFSVAIQTKLHKLAAPVDGVTVHVDDEPLLHADVQRAMRFGFEGKLCIHPRQVASVHMALRPKETEIAWAQRVLEGNASSGGAAFQLDGRMVDTPVVLQAQRTLQRLTMYTP